MSFFPFLQDWRSEPPGSPHPRLCLDPKRCSPGSTQPAQTHPLASKAFPVPLGSLHAGQCREVASAQRPAEVALRCRSITGLGCCLPPPSLASSKTPQVAANHPWWLQLQSLPQPGPLPSRAHSGLALRAPTASALPDMSASEWLGCSGGQPPAVPSSSPQFSHL